MLPDESAFDKLATSYDNQFSHTSLGRYYRGRVQNKMKHYWPEPGDLLELNAGTGEDAIFLASLGHKVLATDISPAMLQVIRSKLDRNAKGDRVQTQQLAIEDIGQLTHSFDGILSNFGGINCIADLPELARQSHQCLQQDSYFIAVFMGPWVPWEWGYYSLRLEFAKAFRRIAKQCQWRNTQIYYPSIEQIKAAMAPYFNLVEAEALGLFMPPTYVQHQVDQWPKLYRVLTRMEKVFCKFPGIWQLSDHYLLVFKKRG